MKIILPKVFTFDIRVINKVELCFRHINLRAQFTLPIKAELRQVLTVKLERNVFFTPKLLQD